MKKKLIDTEDGYVITAHHFTPENANGSTVVIAGGVGLPQRFFFKFANWLSAQGCHAYTFDYRGIALSRPPKLKGMNASYKEWTQFDFKAITDHARKNRPDDRLLLVGHSFGGNSLGMGPAHLHYNQFLTVGSQFGYYRNFPWQMQLTILLGFGLLTPLLTALIGYFPSPWFGLGEPLPKQVAKDWATLLLHEKSMLHLADRYGENQYHLITKPILMISIHDDAFAPKKSVDALAQQVFVNAKVERKHLIPTELGVRSIGHNDFFRKKHQESLWPMVTAWFKL